MFWEFGAVSSVVVPLEKLGVPVFSPMNTQSSTELHPIPFLMQGNNPKIINADLGFQTC